MQFSILKLAVAALAICSDSVLGQTTPAQVVQNIDMVTKKSNDLIAPAQKIDLVSGPLLIIGLGPSPPSIAAQESRQDSEADVIFPLPQKIITGFVDIVSTVTTAMAQMQGMPPVPAGPQSDAIFEAFREFVRIHQMLLNVLIGKAGLFSTIPLIGAPVAAVLRQVEAVVDSVAFALIGAVQSRATDLQVQAGMLTGTITTTIDRYEGLKLN
ncbi:UVI-1 protein [Colletotrichum scovillei]|uniref:UVI-1 protein n=1 Tax=Colletotrichum scovillei TaxID=1209932 RepID=A0A9P7R722_9PEZI|nr:UVI-1 protein [Colletotrichum scovillei]KAG7070424.1 UVI-1 protein [Colletotrichum scovillei]KAG7078699.1 UVI-1 protein [Colletotrichum scovillei]